MRALTTQEFSQFVAQHPLLSYDDLPPWGGVVKWGDRAVLVYFAPETHKLFLTDVTDNPHVLDANPPSFDPLTLTWWYHFPQEVMNTINSYPNPLAPTYTVPIAIIAIVLLVLVKGR